MPIKMNYIQNWDCSNFQEKNFSKTSKIPIIHVIGIVGAGKSKFIKKFLYNYPTFDIKEIYQNYSFNPKDFQADPEKYSQFQSALDYSFSKFYEQLERKKLPVGIVESSGINHALNNILRRFFVYRIWIIPNKQSENSKPWKLYEERPYAEELNKHLMQKFEKNEVPFNNKFDFANNHFLKELPSILKNLF
ncbi:MAG: hypothetical protein ACTSWX_00130 [Promethearchaeota archaeon]